MSAPRLPLTPLEQATILADDLHPRISHLGLDSWKKQVYGLIFFNAYQAPYTGTTKLERVKEQEAFALIAFALVTQLEKMESIALLKLPVAVWKGHCQMHPTKELKTVLDFLHWCKFEWKADKTVHRSQPAIDIIAECVQPFL